MKCHPAWLFFLTLTLASLVTFAFAQEGVTDEGFPADWTAEDFAPAEEDPQAEMSEAGGMDERDDPNALQIAPYGTAPTAPALRQGVASFRVEQLPSVSVTTTPSDSSTVSASASTSFTTIPLNQVFNPAGGALMSTPVTTRTKVKSEDLATPEDVGASALGAYGVIQRTFTWGSVKGLQDGWDTAVRRTWPVAEGDGTAGEAAALTRAAMRRALSSALAAAVPAPDGIAPEDWLAWRMQRLMELGNADLAWQLARPVTPIAMERNANLRRAWAEVSLLVGDVPNACAALKTEAASGAQSGQSLDTGPNSILPHWRQAVMACQALERGRDGLGLSLAAATADGMVFPALLETLLETIAENGPAPKVPAGTRAGVLEAALYAAYPALIREETWPMLPNVVLWRLIRTEALPLSLRAQAAEWLTAQDGDKLIAAPQTSPAAALTQFYGLFNFTSTQLADPVTSAASLEPVMQRALLWQSASSGSLTSWQGWQNAARAAGLAGLAATVPVPATLLNGNNTAPLLLATRQAMREGDFTSAQTHFNKLKDAEGLTIPAIRARATLGVLLGALSRNPQQAQTWLTQWQVALPVATIPGKQASLSQLALWVELGLPLPPEARASVLTRVGEVPGGAQWPLWQPLVLDALAEGKTAAALAQVASAMPEAGGIVPGWVQPALRTLSVVGDEDARRRVALAVALAGADETTPITPTPQAPLNVSTTQNTPAISGLPTQTPAIPASGTVNYPLNTPNALLFQFMQGLTSPTTEAPSWLLPPPRVPGPTPPTRPTVPTP